MCRPLLPGGSQWFHESINELVCRLHSFSAAALLSELKKLPVHRQPVLDSECHRKTSTNLIVHVLRRVLHLLEMQSGALGEIVLSLCHKLRIERVPSPACLINIIVEYEYGSSILKTLSEPVQVVSKTERVNERAKISRREEKILKARTVKETLESFEASWPSLVPQTHILECLNAYREGTIWTDPPFCAVCGIAVTHDVNKYMFVYTPR